MHELVDEVDVAALGGDQLLLDQLAGLGVDVVEGVDGGRVVQGPADLALELAVGKLQTGVTDADRDRLVDEFITRVEPGTAGGVAR